MRRAPCCKHWCFTLNNFSDDEEKSLQSLWSAKTEGVKYLIYGKEKGEEGTPHLQGFISFEKRERFVHVKRLLSERAHIEKAQGTPKQASTYCKKEGDYVEFGDLPGGQGTRTDLQEVVTAVKAGKSLREIADEFPATMVRYGSGVQRLRIFHRPLRESPP